MSRFNQLQNVLFFVFFPIPALYSCAPGGGSKFKSPPQTHVVECIKETLCVPQMHDLLRELLLCAPVCLLTSQLKAGTGSGRLTPWDKMWVVLYRISIPYNVRTFCLFCMTSNGSLRVINWFELNIRHEFVCIHMYFTMTCDWNVTVYQIFAPKPVVASPVDTPMTV